MEWLRRWRRSGRLEVMDVTSETWQRAVRRYPFVAALTSAESERLRTLVAAFLKDKSIHGAAGMRPGPDVRLSLAIQACILILNLGLKYYRGWREVVVYPDEFVAEYEYMDEAGVVHHVRQATSGESWERGPVILSWADAEEGGRGEGYNVVIHEFAHKLDMLNGGANGYPPLHSDMSRTAWAEAFSAAYADFCRRVDQRLDDVIDPYGAESPAEFFAVASEAFLESPRELRALYPDVYTQLALFYRQDPAQRSASASPVEGAGVNA